MKSVATSTYETPPPVHVPKGAVLSVQGGLFVQSPVQLNPQVVVLPLAVRAHSTSGSLPGGQLTAPHANVLGAAWNKSP